MKLTSPAFADGETIPDEYTCRGAGVSPPLNISGMPSGTQSLALIAHDPDAPSGDFVHWTVWNISAASMTIKENSVPSGATQGLNDFKQMGYGAPCPPSDTHQYVFELYALNRELALEAGAHVYALKANLEGHVLAKATLTGHVSASS